VLRDVWLLTAKNLVSQLRHSAIVSLLPKPLAEEENDDQLLNQVARLAYVGAYTPRTRPVSL
jgi:hypothetical protein